VSGWPRDELVEARADAILAGLHTAEAYVEHFEAQMHASTFEAQMRLGQVRKLLAPLRVFRRKSVIWIKVGRGPAALAVGPGSVWVAAQDSGTVSRIDPRTDRVTATVSVAGAPTSLTITGSRLWTGVRQTVVTTGGDTAQELTVEYRPPIMPMR
jgi:YVTN family beta-propeller protein